MALLTCKSPIVSGKPCDIEHCEYIAVKHKFEGADFKIEIMVEKISKLNNGNYQGVISGFNDESGRSAGYESDAHRLGDKLEFAEHHVHRMVCPR